MEGRRGGVFAWPVEPFPNQVPCPPSPPTVDPTYVPTVQPGTLPGMARRSRRGMTRAPRKGRGSGRAGEGCASGLYATGRDVRPVCTRRGEMCARFVRDGERCASGLCATGRDVRPVCTRRGERCARFVRDGERCASGLCRAERDGRGRRRAGRESDCVEYTRTDRVSYDQTKPIGKTPTTLTSARAVDFLLTKIGERPQPKGREEERDC